jgi:hypothetical protein
MNCINHPEQASIANCDVCQRPFCQNCLTKSTSGYTCRECIAKSAVSKRGEGNSTNLSSPGVAFGLGLIPGVGALCNGEYLKAFVHVMIFGFLISISNSPGLGSFESLFVLLTVAFYFFMPLEAYHTAKRKLLESQGISVAGPERDSRKESLWTGVILTFMGGILFLNNVVHGFIEQAFRFWPTVLIGFGIVKILGHLKKSRTRGIGI